ncbi:MAG: hypothetical protein M3R25_13365, partial [Bacteroidota bacterium]|nr:hypothetical protein [Bacteroidota bacterium]
MRNIYLVDIHFLSFSKKIVHHMKFSGFSFLLIEMNIRSLILILLSGITLELSGQQSSGVMREKEAKIFTTSEHSTLRLSRTGSKKFQPAVQPLETEVAIFVNPQIAFQTFLGIGGAVTDASAEVFAK